ncbi:MAG: AI-2E family transporter [Lachnospiraceae bacterium]|nr:AI-2E family transporter [Lachnospiraceae bacterium]
MFDNQEKRRQLAKWVIGVVTSCILIYLGIRHIADIAESVAWLFHLVKPLAVGFVLALILNVPMRFIENKLLKRFKMGKGRRPIAIILAIFLVIGIFLGAAFLVVPELLNAIKLMIEIVSYGLGELAGFEGSDILSNTPLMDYLDTLNIDWIDLQQRLDQWLKTQSKAMAGYAIDTVSSIAEAAMILVIGFAFSIYSLAQKERLKHQACRLIRAWLPQKAGSAITHIASVCSSTFQLFVAGQATEAIILGTLCMTGMVILRIPYAPMIGALIGVTALIPIVGAYAGTIIGTLMILTANPFKAFVFVIFIIILQQIEGNVIYPRVVGSKIRLPAIWVLASVTIGGGLGGPIGMLLGVPAASAAYALLKEATDLREHHLSERRNCTSQQ